MKKLILMIMLLFGISIANEVNDSNIASFKAQCEKGNGEICTKIAGYYLKKHFHSKSKETQDLALKYFTKACDLQNGWGCTGLAVHYDLKEEDKVKALEFYKKACDYKYAYSCSSVALTYLDMQDNTDESKKESLNYARIYFKKACDLGDKFGCDEYKNLEQ